MSTDASHTAPVMGVIFNVRGHLFVVKSFADLIQKHLSTGELWEPELVRMLQAWGRAFVRDKKSAHLVNVGAHIGSVCIPAASCYTYVTAFEAVEQNAEHLGLHARLNGCTNVTVHRVALSDARKSCKIVFNPLNTGGTHVVGDEDVANDVRHACMHERGVSVTCLPLDEVRLIAPPDVVLVDIEGHEDEFLDGARATLEKYHPVLVMEIWTDEKRKYENMRTTSTQMINKVKGMGYDSCRRISADTYVFERTA